ncbi:MAG: hypothetical protein A2X08_12575, partial [Bacteroidetes bacterium GWA2_32_17]
TVTNAAGCTAVTTTTVVVNALPTPTASNTGPYCEGATIQLNVTAATSYIWAFPDGPTSILQNPTRPNATLAMAGVYSVTVTNAGGCTAVATTTVVINSFTAVISDSTMSCSSFPTEVAGTTFLPDGTGVSYSTSIIQTDFPPSATINSVSDITSICFNMEHSWLGDLSIILTCPNGQSISLKEYPGGGGTYLGEPVSNSFPDTSSNINPGTGYDYCFIPSGATYGTMVSESNNYTYSYVDNDGYSHINRFYLPVGTYTPYQSFTNLLGCPINGTWTVDVTDYQEYDNGYIFSWLINFDQSTYPYQYCNGSAIVTPVGGTPPFTYIWSNAGSTDSTNSNLCSGTYCVTVTDSIGCSATTCVTITDVNLNIDSISKVDASCNGVCNGSATVNISGSYTSITYLWSNDSTTQTINNLCAGQYFVTVSEINGCTTIDSVIITQPAFSVNLDSQTNVSCNSLCDGTAQISVSGGTMPYSYIWCNGQTTTNVSGLCAGNCTVTITDANLCTTTYTVTITQPDLLTASITSQTDVSCGGLCDGTATVTAVGGTTPYTYLWCNGQTTQTAINLCAGICCVTVTDANGCWDSTCVTITSPPALIATITDSTMSCHGEPTGVVGDAIFVPDGPSCPEQCYQTDVNINTFSPSATVLSANDLLSICVNMEHSYAGDLSFRIVCPNNQSVVLDSFDWSGGAFLGQPIDDAGTSSCDTTGNPAGTGWTYCWSQIYPQHGLLNILDAGTSPISPTDITNNTNYITPETQLSQLIGCPLNGIWNMEICDNWGIDNGYVFSWQINFEPSLYPSQYCNGSATVTPSGGQPPYTYMWSGGETSDTITNKCSGTYCVTVTDFNGCQDSTCVTIVDVNLNIDSISIVNASCNGVCNGSATANISGGYSPITYTCIWSDGQTTNPATGLCSGQYFVTVTEVNGCTATDSVTITNSYAITANTNIISPISCNGQCDASALVTIVVPGSPPYSYLWCNNDSTSIADNLCAGICVVTVTDNDGCLTTSSVTITAPPPLIASISSQINITCNGLCDGSATASGGGGTPPYNYSWCNGQTTATASGLCAGVCCVTVSDFNGCTATTCVTITEPAILTATITSQTNVTCNGLCNGSATVTPGGGTLPYSYLWCNGQTNDTATGLCAGVCCVTVTDFNGCTATTCVTITEPSALTSSITSQTNVTCNGLCDGTATVTANGGTPGYTYLWCNGGTASNTINLCAGVCTVIISDTNGCTTTSTVTITEPAILTATISSQTDVNCNGDSTGSATVTAIGGTPNYSYDWLPNGFTGDFTDTYSNLIAGFYTVTVTDINGCTDTALVQIKDTSNLQLNLVSSTNPTCLGYCNGQATVAAVGGTPPYTYQWPGGGSGINLCNGTYIVTVTDANSCSRLLMVVITEPQALNFTTSVTNPVCNSDSNGTATATVSGGTPSYTYLWCNGQTTQTATNLPAGTCGVTVSDANFCPVAPQTVTITSPPILNATLNITQNISCNGVCNGILTANPSGGVGPYIYAWSPNVTETNQVADSLCAGNYSVTVTDFYGCTVVTIQTLNTPSPVIATITNTTMVGCQGNCSGTATVDGSGGTAPYSYIWYNGDTIVTTDSLCAGFYGVTVTDFNGCTDTAMVNIIDTSNLALNIISNTPPLCFGECNGTVTVLATGGYPSSTPPFYTYIWSNGQTGPTAINLCSTTNLTVTVFDDSICSRTIQVTVTDPAQLISSTSSVNSLCSSSCNGIGIVNASGGTGSLSYLWDDALSQTNDTAIGLCAGTYHVIITDTNNCSIIDSIDITSPPPIILTLSEVIPITCYNNCNGSVTASVLGGIAPYSYLWSTSSTNDTISGLCAGTYILTVTDSNLCQAVDSITITQPDSLQLSFINVTQIACGGGNCTGEATAQVTGGTPTYHYNWDVNANTGDTLYADSLCGNIYFLTVTDFNGCTVIDSVAIIDTSNLSISIINTNMVTCSGSCDGSATVQATGGYPPYTYLWSCGGQTTPTATNLCQGICFVTVTDSLLCSRVAMITITDAATLTVTDSIIPISCTGLCDASIILIPSGGTPPYVLYQWSIAGETDSIASNLCPGTYYYSVTDNASCIYIDSVSIVDPGTMLANLSIANQVLCHGVCVGSIVSNPSGSFGYTFNWSNGDTTQTISNLCGGWYIVTITGVGGCAVIDSINLIEPDTMLVSFINIQQVNCGGDCSGSVTAQASGGTPSYTYQWDANADSATTAMIDSLCANLYFITVSDANGCSQNLNFEVTDTSNMSLLVSGSSMVSCFGKCDGWVTVSASGGTMPYEYIWNTLDTTVTIDSLCAGMYLVTVSDLNLCSRVKLVNITQPDSLYAIISDSLSIICNTDCNGSLTVSIIGGTPLYNLLWNNSSIDSVLQNLCVGTYMLTVTDSHNCQDSLTYSLTSPPAIITSLTTTGALCNNNTTDGSVSAIVSGGISPYTFLWSNDSITDSIYNVTAGNYWLTVTDSIGCIKVDSATIGASIIVNATAKHDTIICYGDTVQIFGFGGNVYSWSPTTGLSDSTVFDPWAKPNQTTTYYFTAWDNICYDVDSVIIQVYPQVGVDAGTDQTILFEHSAILTATSTDLSATFIWYPTTGLSDSTTATTTATPYLTTIYIVYATNSYGCVEIDSVTVTVIPKIIIPTGITPNGDGSNDVWIIDLIGYYPNIEVEIFNRWGEKLFYSKGYPDSERWDGNFKGKPLPTGTYYYIINLHDEIDTKPITGPITIMR